MRRLLKMATIALVLGTASADAASMSTMAPHSLHGCLDHAHLLSRAAYRSDTAMQTARCGHLLSTEIVVRPRPSDRT